MWGRWLELEVDEGTNRGEGSKSEEEFAVDRRRWRWGRRIAVLGLHGFGEDDGSDQR